jgi:hypothetical protein
LAEIIVLFVHHFQMAFVLYPQILNFVLKISYFELKAFNCLLLFLNLGLKTPIYALQFAYLQLASI